MRALSVTHPWAWFIIHGGKTVENRGWDTRYRGRVLIHAASRLTSEGYHAARMFVQREVGLEQATAVPFMQGGGLALGGVIGAVTIVDVLPPTTTPKNPWHMAGYFGFVLADPEPLPFYRCKGALNFWGDFEVVGGNVVPTSGVRP